MSTLDLLDDSFPHGTPDGYRRGCRTAACPALIPCRTVHTRYAGDFSFAKLIDAGTPLAEILERDAAARDQSRQRDKIAAREERRAAAEATRPRRPKQASKRTPPARAARPPKTAPLRITAPRPTSPRTRTHPGYQWIDKARLAAETLPVERASTFAETVDDYEAALDRHVDELAQWRSEHRDLRTQLRSAAETLKTATIAAGSGLSVGGVIERALQDATARHQAAVDELAKHDRPVPPARPRMPRPQTPRAPRVSRPRQVKPREVV